MLKQPMRLWHLTASAACAALLGLATSGLVRAHLSDLMSMEATDPGQEPSYGSPSEQRESTLLPPSTLCSMCCPAEPDGDFPEAVEPKGTESKMRPTWLSVGLAARSARSARPASSRNPIRDTLSQELAPGITKLGERRYEIKRSTLDLALGNLGLLSRWVRVAPEIRAGRPFGFRLFAVAADGPFAKLGLRDEDVLVSVNGLDVTTPDHVLEAYSKLKTARHLALKLVRGGHEIVQDYTIR
jgi:hypothetical protein